MAGEDSDLARFILPIISFLIRSSPHREGGSQVYLLITEGSTGFFLRLNGRNISCISVLPELTSYLSDPIARAVIMTQNMTVLKTYSIPKAQRKSKKRKEKEKKNISI